MNRTVRLPIAVQKIITRLEQAGFEAYAVGGCVRDTLLQRTPEDWDITTSARPEEVKQLFRRSIDTGIEHGTVTVLMRGEDTLLSGEKGFEVTTYRLDGAYLDGRHPSGVTFTPSLREDLARRDFTVNAMAYNEREGLVDIFGGLRDLSAGRLRAVGDAEERFMEDALRMLRAIRFSAQLGFSIVPETYEAICRLAPRLGLVSKERIAAELTKLLLSEHPEQYVMLFETGLAGCVIEHFEDAFRGGLPRMTASVPAKKYLRYAMLLRNAAEQSETILRELKLDNETVRKAGILSRCFGTGLPGSAYEARKRLSELGEELYFDWLSMERALSPQPLPLQGETVPETVPRKPLQGGALPSKPVQEEILRAELFAREALQRGDCIGLSTLAVSGKDLILAGEKKGPEIGRLLQELLEEVLREPEHNTKEWLLGYLGRRAGAREAVSAESEREAERPQKVQ